MREVPDILAINLKILFIGYNPGVRSAKIGHHFAGHSNRFWKLLYASGLTPEQIKPEEDQTILRYGYGITNIVARPSRTAAEIAKEEFAAGREILQKKLFVYKPTIACHAGIGVYKEFAGAKNPVCGLQTQSIVEGVRDFVVPSPSGLNRMVFAEQLFFYKKLHELVAIRA